ncbi:GMC family oxidoreductase N-terminal domain-containing protein [Jiella sp. MQZ9-1]|uniref:GMC family oxidoreductase N-terminal domain-containing protein n=1 Tax=Jiella flava TaxID=2816857 RepID=A0A939FVY6_9HYPH|nr:GMC family oxidoreductase N-terminal domain-containing protein [Jiella flava]MBO0662517.1 GMC family oxidoreductase N-terminal domain-containing protein [Jiella flava]MCD2471742.1 GMC family oxidoreductase N-terminal domain-containing protein [Jiella flava]
MTATRAEFDTIIVGAGSAGCVLAARLSADPARRVLLVEAGGAPPETAAIPSDWPTLFNTAADWSFHTAPQPGCRGRRIFWPRGKMLGGSGSMNAMIYLRGLPSDYDGWAAMGCPGWDWKRVRPDFIAGEDNPKFAGDPYHGVGGPLYVADSPYRDPGETAFIEAAEAAGHRFNADFNGASQDGVGYFQFTLKDGARRGTFGAYLKPALTRPNLTVKTGIRTTRICLQNGRAAGIEGLERGEPVRFDASGEVILAAGAIASPHLLMLSGIGPADHLAAAGVTPRHDLPGVGQNLQDHINIQIAFAAKAPLGIGAWSEADLAASLAEWRDRRTGPRTSPFVAAGGHVTTRYAAEPDLQLYGAVSPHRDYARFLYPGSGFTLHAVLQRPQSRGEIRLASADPLEPPIIDPRYFDGGAETPDLATLVEGVKINRAIAATAPLAALISHELSPSAECRTDADIVQHIRGHCSTLYHPSSTCRMGRDAMAVTDPESFAVHGIEGLAVADASVFPKMISANLNATVILIAERAATRLGAPAAR